MKTLLPPPSVALAALAVGVAATLAAWFLAGRQAQAQDEAEFANRTLLAAHVLDRRVQRYVDLLYGLDALATHEVDLTRREFHDFALALDLPSRLPGVQAVQFVRRVAETDRPGFVERVRRDRTVSPEGYPGFDVKPAGIRPEYWVIDYIEPLAGNEPALGLDVRMRPGANAAAERARDTGMPILTGRYRLVQERGGSMGLVIYLPVYRPTGPKTVIERQARLVGFVDVVARVDNVVAAVHGEPAMQGLRFTLHDVGAQGGDAVPATEANLFYRTATAPPAAAAWYEYAPRHEQRLTIAGRQWRAQFEADPALLPWLSPLPLLTLFAGLAMSFLVFGILRAISRTRAEALALARKATGELRTQLSFTQQLIEAIPSAVFFKDSQGRYLGCNRAFEEYVGRKREEIVGRTAFDLMPEDLADRSHMADRKLLERPGTQEYEVTVANAATGRMLEVIVNKATFYDPSGEVAGLVGVIIDITQRKQLEANTRESNERLRAVIQAAPVAIIARDLDRTIRMWNPAAERILGYAEEEVIGTQLSTVPVDLQSEAADIMRRASAGETIVIEETRRLRKDGSVIDVSLSIAPVHGPDGRATGTIVTLEDITRRKAAEDALRESEANLRLAMEAAQMGMWYWQTDDDRFHFSDGLAPLFGRPVTADLTYRELQTQIHAEDRELFAATMRHAIKQGSEFSVDFRIVWPDGSVHWMSNRGQVHRDGSGHALSVIGVTMDISERKLAEQRIAHMAHHDALTGLPNRVLLRDRIQQAIAHAQRSGQRVAVLFIDLDRFKTINDSLGHELGDRLLQSVASRILVCVREGDTVSRVGGDEFVMVVPGLAGPSDAAAVAGKILEVLGNAFHLHGNDLRVAASIGISLFPTDGTDAETLMRNADTAMYHAKDMGRANFQFFTQHMNVAAHQRLLLETSLRRAVEHEEFALEYQPLFDLRDGSVSGFEALLRWHPPGGSPVPPGQFIHTAEDAGLIVPIGEWVIREALRQAREWQLAGRPVRISINVSAKQLARSTFVERLRRAIQDNALDPALVELEVTESVIIEGAGEARDALDQVAALGVGIAIDDFGTGYSGLAYLKRLPIDTVKIDQSFVRDLTIDPDDAAIVTAIVAMARSLNVEVVAEGVETAEQLAELKRLGCQRAQGYFLARPMSAARAAALLAEPATATGS